MGPLPFLTSGAIMDVETLLAYICFMISGILLPISMIAVSLSIINWDSSGLGGLLLSSVLFIVSSLMLRISIDWIRE